MLKPKFGDIFKHPVNNKLCVVIYYNNDKNWWYVEEGSSIVATAEFIPSECIMITRR